MKITSLKNEKGARVHHVIDEDCIHEFRNYKEAQEFVAYLLSLKIPGSPFRDEQAKKEQQIIDELNRMAPRYGWSEVKQ